MFLDNQPHLVVGIFWTYWWGNRCQLIIELVLYACGRAHKHYDHIWSKIINNTYIIMFILTFPGRYWTCWCWMITSQSWQSPFRSHWYQQSPVMGSQAPPQPAVQASTQITQLTPSLSQLVTTLMVFTRMPQNSSVLLSKLLFIAISSQY